VPAIWRRLLAAQYPWRPVLWAADRLSSPAPEGRAASGWRCG